MASATRRSATRASCSICMRSTGSTLASLAAPGGDADGELPGALPGPAALLPEHASDVAEERHALEGVAGWTGVAHKGIVGRMASASDLAGAVVVVTGAASALGQRVVAPGRRRPARSRAWSRLDRRTLGRLPARRRGAHRRPRHRRPQAAPRGRHRDRPPRPVHRPRGRRRRRPRSATARWPAGCSTPPRPSAPRTSCSSPAPRSTAPGPTTRCRSPRTPRCAPTRACRFAYEKAELERQRRRVARRPPRRHRRPAAAHRHRRRPTATTAGWPGPSPGRRRCRSPTTSRRPSSSTSTTWPPAVDLARRGSARRSPQRGARRLDQRRHRAGPGRRPAAAPAARAPRRPAGRDAVALGPGAHAARAAALHRAPVGGRQRPAAGRRLGAASSNEEAYVGAHRAGPWATLSPRRRQELALGAAGVALAGAAVGAVALLRRRSPRLTRSADACAARASGPTCGLLLDRWWGRRRSGGAGSWCGRAASGRR